MFAVALLVLFVVFVWFPVFAAFSLFSVRRGWPLPRPAVWLWSFLVRSVAFPVCWSSGWALVLSFVPAPGRRSVVRSVVFRSRFSRRALFVSWPVWPGG